jgi:hypothetical protein
MLFYTILRSFKSASITRFTLLASALALASCGGGGGGGGGSSAPATPAPTPTYEVSASLVKARVDGANCELFQVNGSGSQSTSIASGVTSDGAVNFGNAIEYQGTALISCSGGTYTDEATGSTLTAPTLRAVVSLNGNGAFSVTPLTEIATRHALASGSLEAALNSHNDSVADTFGIAGNITTVTPTDLASTAASNNDAGKYATALALISVLNNNIAGDLSNLLEALATDLSDGSFSTNTAADIATAEADLASSAVAQNLNDDALSAVSSALDAASDSDSSGTNTGDTRQVDPADVYVDPQGNIDANGAGFANETIPCSTDAPSTRFDFSDWYISTPKEGDSAGDDQTIYETELMGGYIDTDLFCLGRDNGLVLKTTIGGLTTSSGTQYTRTEFREMLRGGDTSIRNSDLANNWAFSHQPESTQNAAAAVDGTLHTTLAVNHVTTTFAAGSEFQVGRLIIGQIHAKDDEPIRLYYRKLPNNSNGSIYFATEENGADDTYINIIGSRSSSQSDPADGIPLNEAFAFQIRAVAEKLYVTITKADGTTFTPLDGDNEAGLVNEDGSVNTVGYGIADDYMYFKAGIYTGNSTGDDEDYDQVTIYSLDNIH